MEAYALESLAIMLADRGYDDVRITSDPDRVVTGCKDGHRYHARRVDKVRIEHLREDDPSRIMFICDMPPTPSAAAALRPSEWWTIGVLQFRPTRHALAARYNVCGGPESAKLAASDLLVPMLDTDAVACHYGFAPGTTVRATVRYGNQPAQLRFYRVAAS